MKIIVLFAPPGGGKGTQAANIIERYGLIHVSMGDILRDIRAKEGELGDQIKFYQDSGILVPDPITIKCLENFLEYHRTEDGYIFDGFPRNLDQDDLFSKFLGEKFPGINPIHIYFSVDKRELVQRLSQRAKIQQRKDDTPEVIKQRLSIFKAQTLPVIERYHRADKLHIINGTGKEIPEVWTQVQEIIQKNYSQVNV